MMKDDDDFVFDEKEHLKTPEKLMEFLEWKEQMIKEHYEK